MTIGLFFSILGSFAAYAAITHLFIPYEILGVFLGFLVFMFAFPLFPSAVDMLVNNPNRHRLDDYKEGEESRPLYDESEFGFFTRPDPGRVKIVMRGGKFMYCIARFADHCFQGEHPDKQKEFHDRMGYFLTPRNVRYWDVVPSGAHHDTDPIPEPWEKWRGVRALRWFTYAPISILYWIWKEWVYLITGAVFIGIYPFQRVRTYPLEHFKKVTKPDTGIGEEIGLQRILDYSDHYRVADFQFPVKVLKADTQDKIPVDVLLNVILRTNNPYELAFNTDDDWGARLLGSISDSVIKFTRSNTVDSVLSAGEHAAHHFAAEVEKELRKLLEDIGLEVRSVQVLDISTSDREVGKKLGDKAVAQVDMEAAQLRAKGTAAAVKELTAAAAQNPEISIAMAQIDGTVRAAEAAGKGGGIVILGSSSQTISPGDAALLQQLRKNGQQLPTPTQDQQNPASGAGGQSQGGNP